VQAQKALRESEERLRFAAEVGRMYAWEWDPATDAVLRSAECASILGLVVSPCEDVAKNYFELVHPEDRSKLWNLATSLTPEDPEYRTEYRRFRPDGALIWLEESGRGTFDKAGKMIRLIGMTADITERKLAEEALHQKGAALTEAERLAGVGSWQWDARTDTVTWSAGLYRLAGRDPKLPAPSRKEQLGLLFSPENYEREERAIHGALQDGKPYKLDIEVVRPDFTTKWVISRGEPLRDAAGNIIGLRGTLQDITERKLAEEAFASVGRRLIEAQEQERTRIARELHDDICQRLVLLAVVLDQLQSEPPDLPVEVRMRLGELWKQTTEIASDLQSLSHELHSAKLEFLGVAAAMKGFCKEFAKEQKVEIEFHSRDLPNPLSPDISLCLFRVLQEALYNSSKHSGVRHFDVQLWGTSGEIHLMVGDSGKGFDREAVKKSPGLGLISMEERLRLLNGTFSIESRPKRGTTIHARVPLARVTQTTA
jgi:PAS domain S-box-containing protein